VVVVSSAYSKDIPKYVHVKAGLEGRLIGHIDQSAGVAQVRENGAMASDLNGVILQAFHWFMDPDDAFHGGVPLWRFLASEADHFRELGIDAVWIPPACKAADGRHDVGYGIYDHFDLGEFNRKGSVATKYGTKQDLHDAVNAMHGFEDVNGNLIPQPGKKYIHVYADAVLNHKMDGAPEAEFWDAVRVEPDDRRIERWAPGYESGPIAVRAYTGFDHPERNGRYSAFKWRARHFDSVDSVVEITQGGGPPFPDGRPFIYRFLYNEEGYVPHVKAGFDPTASHEKGNYDYLTGVDLDYSRHDVREEMKYWGRWLTNTVGVDGYRLDAVKHVGSGFIREWLGDVRAATPGKDLFAVGEYLSGDIARLHAYLTDVTAMGPSPQALSLLDFPLRFKIRDASWQGESYDLSGWNRATLMAEQPARAVTLVETHDFEFGRDLDSHVREWIKPLAYAFILLRGGGYPMVFFPDFYGSHASGPHLGQPPGREYLSLLLRLRKQFALGEDRFYGAGSAIGWVRMGGVPGARGAMAVVLNTAHGGVRAVRMDTGQSNRRFYHLATLKHLGSLGEDAFQVVRGRYDMYGDKADELWTDGAGWAEFVADSGTVSVWLEDGAVLI
jgi:alpha-amylase